MRVQNFSIHFVQNNNSRKASAVNPVFKNRNIFFTKYKYNHIIQKKSLERDF